MPFFVADTPQKADDSHCVVFLMHSFIKYVLFKLIFGLSGSHIQ